MTAQIKILCDSCQANLTQTTNSIDYRLKLSCEVIPCHKGAVTDMMVYPPIDADKHFCSKGCLQKYVIHG